MKRTYLDRTRFLLVCFGILTVLVVTATAQESGVVLDPNTGNYIITYRSEYEPHPIERVVWVPATKIAPTVRSEFRAWKHGIVSYRYDIKNGASGQQPIDTVVFGAREAQPANQMAPDHWIDSIVSSDGNPNFVQPGYIVGWAYNYGSSNTPAGIEPKHSLHGFGLDSTYLPGVAVMQLSGATPPDQGFPGGNPEADPAVGDKLEALITHNYVPRYAAVPWIPVPTPFNAAAVLTGLQKHVDQDLVSMKLIDPSLVATLDPLFQSAITAAQGGNNEALRSDLRALRRSLSNEHGQEEKAENADRGEEVEDDGERAEVGPRQPIAKLARDVLEFDLKYLERQVKPGKRDAGG